MSSPLTHVQPGDLIRAEFINEILDGLSSLDARVAALETAGGGTPQPGAVVITHVSPTTVRVGETLTITGRNFGWTTGANVVVLDGQLITSFVSGSNLQVIFTVPEMTVPAAGKSVELLVGNATSSSTTTVTLLPRTVTLEGDIEITYVGTTPSTPVPGTFLIQYRLTSRATLDVGVILSPKLSTGWSPLRVLLAGPPPTPLSPPQVTVHPREDILFVVEVTVPAGTGSGTPFTLEMSGSGAGLATDPVVRSFQVGAAAEQEAGNIDLSAPAGTSITVARGATKLVGIECEFSETGSYDLATRFVPIASGWQVDTSDVPHPINVTSIPSSGLARPGWVPVPVQLGLKAPGTLPASQPLQLFIDVQKEGQPLKRSLLLQLTAT